MNIFNNQRIEELLKSRIKISDLEKVEYNREVVVSGWITNIKNMGKICFIVLKDKSGEAQLTLKEENLRNLDFVKDLSLHTFIVARGKYIKGIAKKWKEIVVEEIYVLGEIARPLPIESRSTLEKRLDYRWIDLRDDKSSFPIIMISDFVKYSREFFYKNGFVEIFTPKILGTPSEGGAEVFEIQYFSRKAYLAQSPQFYKQMAIVSGFEKVFEISHAYRAEPSFTTRHLTEFISLDVEVGYISSHHDVMDILENLIVYTLNKLKEEREEEIRKYYNQEINIPSKIPRIKMEEAYEIIGKENIKPNGDITPAGERILGEYVKNTYNSEFFFLIDWPWEARPFYHMKGEPMKNGKETTKSFDLIYRGLEVATGAQREHRYSILLKQIKEKGLNEKNLEFFLEFFKYGSPTMGGFGFGVERFIKQLLGIENIREVAFLPRDPNRIYP
ncbi:MAG: aspartate--tRNA(Asn) ligase [Candidatus Aenigmatarchaeota archaeon]